MNLLKNKLTNFFVTIALLIPLLLFSQKSEDHNYKEALSLLKNDNNIDKANILLDKAIKKDSLNRDYLLLKSRILFSKSDCPNSLTYLQKVILIDKKFSDSTAIFFSDLADCLGDKATSIEVLTDFLNKNKSDLVKVNLAQKYFLNKKYDESILLYKEFVNDNPNDIEAIVDLIRMLFSFKSPEEAIVMLKNGLKNNPNNITLLNYLASCYHNTNDINAAIEVENQIIKLEYKAEHIASRAMLYELGGKKKEAYQDYLKIIELKKCNTEYYLKILQYEFENKLYEKVIEHSYKVIQCDPKNESIVLDGLYTSLFFCQNFKDGDLYLNKKLEPKPDIFNPYYLKAIVLLRNREYENVLKYLDLALKTNDIEKEDIVKITLLKLGYYLIKEDYEGLVNYWKSGNVKSLDNNLNFTFVEDPTAEKVQIKTDFNKATGVVGTSILIPTKVFRLLIDKYGLKIN